MRSDGGADPAPGCVAKQCESVRYARLQKAGAQRPPRVMRNKCQVPSTPGVQASWTTPKTSSSTSTYPHERVGVRVPIAMLPDNERCGTKKRNAHCRLARAPHPACCQVRKRWCEGQPTDGFIRRRAPPRVRPQPPDRRERAAPRPEPWVLRKRRSTASNKNAAQGARAAAAAAPPPRCRRRRRRGAADATK